VRYVYIKCELLVERIKHLVVLVISHEIQTRANVSLLALRDEIELQ
jgi:hypothetical protein